MAQGLACDPHEIGLPELSEQYFSVLLQSLGLLLHSPFEHIIVPVGQFVSVSSQSPLSATQLLYLVHFIGLSVGHPLDSVLSPSVSQ